MPCSSCLKTFTGDHPGRLCGGCGVAKYCDATCQTSDWKTHKETCRQMRTETRSTKLSSTSLHDVQKLRPHRWAFMQLMNDRVAGNLVGSGKYKLLRTIGDFGRYCNVFERVDDVNENRGPTPGDETTQEAIPSTAHPHETPKMSSSDLSAIADLLENKVFCLRECHQCKQTLDAKAVRMYCRTARTSATYRQQTGRKSHLVYECEPCHLKRNSSVPRKSLLNVLSSTKS